MRNNQQAMVRVYRWVFSLLFIVDWFLGVARQQLAPAFETVFKIINFPCSLPFLWIEKQTNPWWYGIFGRKLQFLLNDEIGTMLAFIIMVLLQAFLFSLLLVGLKQKLMPSNSAPASV